MHLISPKVSVRIRPDHPDHHLWNNHGTWWCHYTEHRADFTKHRVRVNLHTSDQAVARFLRDSVLREAGALLPARRRIP